MRRISRSLVLAALAMSSSVSVQAVVPDGLLPDTMRFALMSGDPMLALALAGDRQKPEVLVVRAQALDLLGLSQAAMDILKPVANQADSGHIQSLARFELGRLALASNLGAEAKTYLQKAVPKLSGDNLAEARFSMAEVARLNNDLSGAAAELGRMPESLWAALGYYNLAMAYTKQDSDPSRALVALRVAAAMASSGKSEASRDLRDRIHLAAGELSLRSGEPDKAVSFLNKIFLDSYYAPKALYLHGLALRQQKNQRGAVQSWHRARKFPLGLEGAAEAHLAMGEAYASEGFSGQAGDAWLAASAALDREIVNIDTLVTDIQGKGAFAGLVEASQSGDVDWFLADSQAVTAPRLAYLLAFSEQESIQHAIRRVAELQGLDKLLSGRLDDLNVFAEMLQDSLSRMRSQQDSAPVAALTAQLERLRVREADLTRRLQAADAKSNVEDLVSGPLAVRFDELRSMEKEGRSADSDRVRRLRGTLVWQATNEFQQNRKRMVERLQQIREELDLLAASMSGFSGRVTAAPARFQQQLAEVKARRTEVDGLLVRTRSLRKAADVALTEKALAYMAKRRAQTVTLLDQSQQSIAWLYEELAVSRHKRKQDEKTGNSQSQGDKP